MRAGDGRRGAAALRSRRLGGAHRCGRAGAARRRAPRRRVARAGRRRRAARLPPRRGRASASRCGAGPSRPRSTWCGATWTARRCPGPTPTPAEPAGGAPRRLFVAIEVPEAIRRDLDARSRRGGRSCPARAGCPPRTGTSPSCSSGRPRADRDRVGAAAAGGRRRRVAPSFATALTDVRRVPLGGAGPRRLGRARRSRRPDGGPGPFGPRGAGAPRRTRPLRRPPHRRADRPPASVARGVPFDPAAGRDLFRWGSWSCSGATRAPGAPVRAARPVPARGRSRVRLSACVRTPVRVACAPRILVE